MRIDEAALCIVDALASIEGGRAYIRLARINAHLSAREPERILRIALVQLVCYQGERGVLIDPIGKLCTRLVACSGAVVAVAVRLKTRNIDHIVERTRYRACCTCRTCPPNVPPSLISPRVVP